MEKLFSPLVTLFPLIILLMFCSIPKPCESLKLKLIPPNSPESPLYLGNVTLSKKIETLVNQSKARSHLLFRNPNSNPLHDFGSKITAPFIFQPDNAPLYTVAIGIGTFTGQEDKFWPALLHMDTGSDLTWIQCEACQEPTNNTCFPQEYPVYPSNQSLSYIPLHWTNDKELCYSNVPVQGDDLCYYYIQYPDNSNTFGQLAYETFTFSSDIDDKTSSILGGLVFGCGLNQEGFSYGNNTTKQPNLIAGRFGLGRGVHAIHEQLGPRGSDNKFSYCLSDFIRQKEDSITHLLFGGDIPPIDISTYVGTQLVQVSGNGYYYIKVIDIMVNNDPLLIPSSVFEIKPDGSGGSILDSSTAFSLLAKPAYDKLEAYLVGKFSANSNYQTKQHSHLRVCYSMVEPEGYGQLPRITFVIEGGRMEILPEQAFVVDQDEVDQSFFCLAIAPHYSNETVIGAYQQVNHRFVYDTKVSKLWFKAEECGRNS